MMRSGNSNEKSGVDMWTRAGKVRTPWYAVAACVVVTICSGVSWGAWISPLSLPWQKINYRNEYDISLSGLSQLKFNYEAYAGLQSFAVDVNNSGKLTSDNFIRYAKYYEDNKCESKYGSDYSRVCVSNNAQQCLCGEALRVAKYGKIAYFLEVAVVFLTLGVALFSWYGPLSPMRPMICLGILVICFILSIVALILPEFNTFIQLYLSQTNAILPGVSIFYLGINNKAKTSVIASVANNLIAMIVLFYTIYYAEETPEDDENKSKVTGLSLRESNI